METITPTNPAFTPIGAEDLAFITRCFDSAAFRFAKTMPQNPHEYTLRQTWENDEDFQRCVLLIRAHGYREKFGNTWYVLMRVGDYKYWTMGCPLFARGLPWQETKGSVTILINRKAIGVDGPGQ